MKKIRHQWKAVVSRANKKDRLVILSMLIPSIVLFLVISVYPFSWVFKFVFYQYDGFTKPNFVGLENFVRIFTRDTMFWDSVLNTFHYAIGKLMFIIPLSLVLATMLNQQLKGKNFFRVVFFLPTIVSSAVASMIWYFIFSPYNGILNSVLQLFGFNNNIDWLGNPKYAMTSAIFVAIWSGFGNYMILFLAGLQSIPGELYESAKVDGVNFIQEFYYITIPMLGPVMKVIMMLAIVQSLKDYASIMVLTNGGPFRKTQVMFLYVYKLMFGDGELVGKLEYGYGATVGLVSAIIVGAITFVYFKFSKKMDNIY